MNRLDSLNPMQREAVLQTEGPLLVLAGAGSGKTRALTHRVAYLIEEKHVKPWNILAITFTNKAAGEMRERVNGLVEHGADSVWVSTFHSLCVRILRRFIGNLGYETGFSIYDADDSKTLMKQIYKDRLADNRYLREKTALNVISAAKNEYISSEEFYDRARAEGDFRTQKIAELYLEYQSRLKKNNALDFDDLLMKTAELFETRPEVLDYYQERFRYIMVDEYQDTNTVQFKLVSLLAKKYGNLCVVGDDDQSIYRFRGANIRNILSFEETFPGARVIRLEQNYRSTKTILNAANGVIRNNTGRKEKTLWTENEEGEKLRLRFYDTSYDEAEGIVRDIIKSGGAWKDNAVLYRTNAQSRLLEEKCVAYSVPYRLVGGVNFYQRKEIKDILAYLKTVANGRDDLAAVRVINVPKRGIGAATVGRISRFAAERGMSFYDALLRVQAIPGMGKAAAKIDKFTDLIGEFRRMVREGAPISDVIHGILTETGYQAELMEEGETEAQARLENIEELVNKAADYWENTEGATLDGFLEDVALVADIDSMDDSEDCVVLMTLHAAKGLEFPYVYLSGMEEGLFPSSLALSEDEEALEEERRLCYVGITRAKKRLTLTAARKRMVKGETRLSRLSRFVEEIPEELLLEEEPENSVYAAAGAGSRGGVRAEAAFDESGLPWAQKKSGGMSVFGEKPPSYAMPGDIFDKRPAGIFPGMGGFGAGTGTAGGGSAAGETGGSHGAGKPAFGKAFAPKKAESLDYGEGDRVLHARFGEGTVTGILDAGKDYQVTVDFDGVGVRKMFASFANLKKLG